MRVKMLNTEIGNLEYTDIIVEKKYPIGYISINRPEKRNTLTFAPDGTQAQMAQACDEMKNDPQIRAFVIKGAGPCFSAGFDLTEGNFTQPSTKDTLRKGREKEVWTRFFGGQVGEENPESIFPDGGGWWWDALWKNPKPSIAQVHSFCFGAGVWTANFCDVVYATPDAIFGYPPVRFGCPITVPILPPWLLGDRMTRWMALTGLSISAEEALRCGLITKIVPREEIEAEVENVAMAMAKVPPVTNVFTKWSINNYWESQGIRQHMENAAARCLIIENSSLPGGAFDFASRANRYGLKEAQRVQFEEYGAVDELQERERQRLAAELKADKEK
jgi:enoyl-CoA hydratase